MEYEEDLNCALISVELNGKQTLREVSKRFGVSFVRIKQIQDAAVKKLTKRIPDA
jgi:DNA-directed RNA polymerase sigma subunit (sigma70/sigma32)